MRIVKRNKVKQTKVVLDYEEYQSPIEIDQEVRNYLAGQAQLAIRIGISPAMLSYVLKGERRLTEEKYKKMLKLLNQKA